MWDETWYVVMKTKGKHPHKALSTAKVGSLGEPGRYADGNGLYLIVDRSGAKRWVLRTVVQGKRRDMGLGSTRLVSLSEARDKAWEYRKIARSGGDPISARRRTEGLNLSFLEAAERVHAEHSASWRNPKHAQQWINTLKTYAGPVMGKKSIAEVKTSDVLSVLSPIWLTIPETARRVAQRISATMDWAKAAGFYEGENPVPGALIGLPKQPTKVRHLAAMPYADTAEFITTLREAKATAGAKLALELVILTAIRTSEVLLASREEIDTDSKVWTIPAERMKSGEAHRVPLCSRAIEIIEEARQLPGQGDFLFPGRTQGQPMSNMTMLKVLRRLNLPYTVHGFRSSFRDWAAEETSFPREVCEMALAHTLTDKVEAAYRRGDLFEKRRDLMEAWASFLLGQSSNILKLKATHA